MDEIKKIRKPRVISPEARAKQIDRKIAKLKAQIEKLEAEKIDVLKPAKVKQAVDDALKNMSPEEIAEKLGLKVD